MLRQSDFNIKDILCSIFFLEIPSNYLSRALNFCNTCAWLGIHINSELFLFLFFEYSVQNKTA